MGGGATTSPRDAFVSADPTCTSSWHPRTTETMCRPHPGPAHRRPLKELFVARCPEAGTGELLDRYSVADLLGRWCTLDAHLHARVRDRAPDASIVGRHEQVQ